MRASFGGLQPREQLLISIAALLVFVTLCYFALIAPIANAVQQRTLRVERKQQDLAWMRTATPELMQLNASRGGASSGESLVVLITRSAQQAGVAGALTGQAPNGEHGMRVRLENASFDSLVLWLGQLQQQHGIGVESADITKSEKPGIVAASIVFARNGQ